MHHIPVSPLLQIKAKDIKIIIKKDKAADAAAAAGDAEDDDGDD